jgi:two-component system, OmpR family, alkaline phosphatase synthesis response regulator PhoP
MTVLIAEDDEIQSRELTRCLERQGHQTSLAATGAEGIRSFVRDKPDLVLLDIGLPDCDGYELCRSIRNIDPTVWGYFVSGNRTLKDQHKGWKVGCDAYITKPFSLEVFVSRVQNLEQRLQATQRPEPGGEPVFTFGHAMVYPCRMIAIYNGREVKLTTSELAIIEAFDGNKGRIISRQGLAQAVWGTAGSDHAIEQQVCEVRKKLEKGLGLVRVIETAYGAGYRYCG